MSVKANPIHNPMERAEPSAHRKYDDIAPPGIEQPPVPGFENQRYDTRFPPYERGRDDGPPGVDRFPKTSPFSEREDHHDRGPRPEAIRDFRDRPPLKDNITDNRFDRKFSPSQDERKRKSASPRRSSRDRGHSPDKSRRRRRDDSHDRDKRVTTDSRNESERDRKDRKRDTSEDEKSKRSKDKRKKKEKKEAERKKKKEKKEKKEQEKLKKAEEKKAKESHDTKEPKEEIKTENEKQPQKEPDIKPERKEPKKEPMKIIKTIKPAEEVEFTEPKVELYADILTEGIDNTVVENYGKINEEKPAESTTPDYTKLVSEEVSVNNDEDEEKDVSFDGLELQVNETELLKSDFPETKSKSNEMLAPLPGPSKWEIDEDAPITPDKINADGKSDSKQIFERSGKVVTSEVLKRAENAIFAKAINAIRPIEIKKISGDRAKLYSGEKEKPIIMDPVTKAPKNIQITISGWNLDDIPPPGTEPIIIEPDIVSKSPPPPSRLSVKERLGCKVEELDKITKDDRNRSRTLSPLSRRAEDMGRNVSMCERRVEVDDRRRDGYRRHDQRSRFGDRNEYERRVYNSRSDSREERINRERRVERKDYRRDDNKDKRPERSRNDRRHDEKIEATKDRDNKINKTRRSRSRSESRDKKRKLRDKKHKKEKEKDKTNKKFKKDGEREEENISEIVVESKVIIEKKHDNTREIKVETAKLVEDRRKPTLDEANFEPDYDLETESEKEDIKTKLEIVKKRERSKSPEKKPEVISKKRRMEEAGKKIQKESSSSDSSESSSDEKHKKKHKKHKRKKSKRDTSSSSDSSDTDSSTERKTKKRHKSSKKLKKKKKSKHK